MFKKLLVFFCVCISLPASFSSEFSNRDVMQPSKSAVNLIRGNLSPFDGLKNEISPRHSPKPDKLIKSLQKKECCKISDICSIKSVKNLKKEALQSKISEVCEAKSIKDLKKEFDRAQSKLESLQKTIFYITDFNEVVVQMSDEKAVNFLNALLSERETFPEGRLSKMIDNLFSESPSTPIKGMSNFIEYVRSMTKNIFVLTKLDQSNSEIAFKCFDAEEFHFEYVNEVFPVLKDQELIEGSVIKGGFAFAGKNTKGEVLKALFNKIYQDKLSENLANLAVIYTDDSAKQISLVKEACGELQIDFFGINFTLSREQRAQKLEEAKIDECKKSLAYKRFKETGKYAEIIHQQENAEKKKKQKLSNGQRQAITMKTEISNTMKKIDIKDAKDVNVVLALGRAYTIADEVFGRPEQFNFRNRFDEENQSPITTTEFTETQEK